LQQSVSDFLASALPHCCVLQALLAAGKGRLQRDTESGQLLFDLVKHADVAEWALWVNSFGDTLYKAVWGDKDTYSMAFAVAGKSHVFNQLQVWYAAGSSRCGCYDHSHCLLCALALAAFTCGHVHTSGSFTPVCLPCHNDMLSLLPHI
jgi:hypothetical protein